MSYYTPISRRLTPPLSTKNNLHSPCYVRFFSQSERPNLPIIWALTVSLIFVTDPNKRFFLETDEI